MENSDFKIKNNDLFLRGIPEDIISKIFTTIETLTELDNLSTVNIIYITTKLMELLQVYKSLNGRQKKRLIILALSEVAEDSDLSDGVEKKILIEIIKNLVPDTIDLIIDVSKGKYSFKNLKKYKFLCCS
jgi:hypothetical protein